MSQNRVDRIKRKLFQKTINLEQATQEQAVAIQKYKAEIASLRAELARAQAALNAKEGV